MSDFILEYDMLESIAKYSKSLGKRSKEYGESLERKIIDAIENVTGTSSSYLTSASDSIRDKVSILKKKSDAFYHLAEQITDLLEVAEEMDKEVAKAIAAQKEYFLDHHESLRIDDWKADLIQLFVDIKNSIPFLDVLVDILDGLDIIFESLKDSIKHWYECEGGKYIVEAIKSVGKAVFMVTLFVITLPAAGFFAVCGAIGAGICAVDSLVNIATSFCAVDAAVNGNPAWAVIYGKQDKLTDVIRQTNFGNGVLNDLSYIGAWLIDTTETVSVILGIAGLGKGLVKLCKGKAFNLLKNKGSLNFSNLKNSAKNGIVDLKSNIKQGYTNFKNVIKGNKNTKSLLGDMPAEDLARYNKYWDDVASGAYDVPYGMNADEYYQYLKGLDKVDDVAKGGLGISKNGSGFRNTLNELDLRGYDEFSQRTNGIFASETDAEKAFKQLLDGDFNSYAKNFDFSSIKDGAVFWSKNQEAARNYAKTLGGTIMEDTQGGKVLNGWDWLNEKFPYKVDGQTTWGTGSIYDQKPLWQAVSGEFADGVTGTISYVHPEDVFGEVWSETEYLKIIERIKEGKITGIEEVFHDAAK